MFGPPAKLPEREIAPDEKLEWHMYLRSLRESERFYRDLGSN
jgi:hypothetical protein